MNDPPVADGHDVITSDDTAVTITLSGSDPNGDSLTFSIVSGPVHGSLGAVTPAGAAAATVVYTPDASFNGGDSFTYKASDGVLDSTVASVSITVIPTPAALFEPPTIEAARGTEFTLALAVDPGRYGISGGEVLLEFPPSVFEVVSYTPGSLLGLDSIVGVQQVDQSSGTIRLSLARVGATPVPTPPGQLPCSAISGRTLGARRELRRDPCRCGTRRRELRQHDCVRCRSRCHHGSHAREI